MAAAEPPGPPEPTVDGHDHHHYQRKYRLVGTITARRKHGGYGCPSWARLEADTRDTNVQLMLSRASYDAQSSDPRFDASIALGTRVGARVEVVGTIDHAHSGSDGKLTIIVHTLDILRVDRDPSAVRRAVALRQEEVFSELEACRALAIDDKALARLVELAAKAELEEQQEALAGSGHRRDTTSGENTRTGKKAKAKKNREHRLAFKQAAVGLCSV